VRKTTKYWVKAVDVGEVKRIVGRHLPECQPEG
jgi:SPX domain protein involved in polyphosphate accumulation